VVLGDRIGVMRDGKLLQMASASEIYNRPADLFVAKFTGASNLLDGRVREMNGEFGTVEARSGERLTAWLPAGVKAGQAVKIAVRPENVRLGGNGAEPNRFPARVAGQRYQGTQTVYELAVLGGRLEALELGTNMRYPVGSDVEVVLPPASCWAYPAADSVDLD
jgi:iron(III) transport system ATP-binding protein